MMTPVDSPETSAEEQYNVAHAVTREIVDKAFRAIQSRFKCLDATKGYLQVFCFFCAQSLDLKIHILFMLQDLILASGLVSTNVFLSVLDAIALTIADAVVKQLELLQLIFLFS